ncbi:hypothetical protein [Sandaracinus amylolyticus]|uniref:hypothetical protein n=1 Tax=Sandaracinus amylolyticus TaxID=927083 RepID=UPI001F266AAC|nr:hypothetical protein [Sandaracinus amylolyticus]UJR81878.1 Tryptophan synthase alpha chain [Sandaracinus amylolyticus]
MTRWLVLSMALLMAMGCGDDDGPAVDEDAGAGVDASTPIDAGPRDASTPVDAGGDDAAATDAGALDASADGDAGADASSPDADTGEEGDTCERAIDVTAGVALTGQSTMTATDDYGPMGPGCPAGGAASGRDLVYVVSPAAQTTYRVRVTPTTPSFDPLLYAVRACGGTGCVAGTTLNDAGEPEEITFTVDAGAIVYVVVDGELSSRGTFDLAVTLE